MSVNSSQFDSIRFNSLSVNSTRFVFCWRRRLSRRLSLKLTNVCHFVTVALFKQIHVCASVCACVCVGKCVLFLINGLMRNGYLMMSKYEHVTIFNTWLRSRHVFLAQHNSRHFRQPDWLISTFVPQTMRNIINNADSFVNSGIATSSNVSTFRLTQTIAIKNRK